MQAATTVAREIPVVTWAGCYDESWRGVIVDEAFSHPAKMSRGLIRRIFDHLFEIGAIKRGDRVCDPFGGVGTTGLEGMTRGVQVVCNELEPKFFALANQNFDLHASFCEATGCPRPIIVNGDSRKLRQHVQPVIDALVSSPPYVSGGHHPDQTGAWNTNGLGMNKGLGSKDVAGYGREDGQLGQMREGDLDAVISSPPYASQDLGGDGQRKLGGNKTVDEIKAIKGGKGLHGNYGVTDGQLGALPEGGVDAVISSPPYAEIASGAGGLNTKDPREKGQQSGRSAEAPSQATDQRYGDSDGQLGKMSLGSVDAVVSSPPWEKGADGGFAGNKWKNPEDALKAGRGNGASDEARLRQLERDKQKTYGDTEGQLGQQAGETFWSAALDIVKESYAVLKPGGVAVWVVKAFVRDKRIVDFPGDWRKLCEHVGFETFLEVHASLVHEEVHGHLFDGEVVKRRERKSFFRRLAEKKGSPRIDFEVVLFMRRPA